MGSLLNCPVCSELVRPPIHQCPNGHLLCASCRAGLDRCLTCREPMGNIRNLKLEKLAEKVPMRCKYKDSGCRLKLTFADLSWHEDACEFRPVPCPYFGSTCGWRGPPCHILQHLESSHEHVSTCRGERMLFRARSGGSSFSADWARVQQCFDRHFMLVVRKSPTEEGGRLFSAVVQLIGSAAEAENFAYHLEVPDGDETAAWEATPLSIYDNADVAIENGDCLQFRVNIDQLLEHGTLADIECTISCLLGCWRD
uniref:E3 ubiquitin-protein ligase n=1 Tax=Amblyomma maculatum TaxID=34609 RepID=G3MSE8_AMBMU